MRELFEETGVTAADYLSETDWLTYEFPPYGGAPHKLAQFRGQRQKWLPPCDLRATRRRSIRWSRATVRNRNSINGDGKSSKGPIPALVVPYKRDIYRELVTIFAGHAAKA